MINQENGKEEVREYKVKGGYMLVQALLSQLPEMSIMM